MDVAPLIRPDWPAHPRVQAIATTRAAGDMRAAALAEPLRGLLPADPVWLRQVHGTRVVDADRRPVLPEADGSVARGTATVCVVRMADCMPVLLSDVEGCVVGAAHAGWRGLAGGVIEATIAAMQVPASRLLAWLGPAIGPGAYEVGEEVRRAFAGYESAFRPTRPDHWRLDLYAVARERLAKAGVPAVYGGNFCTFTESERFFSYRRDHAAARMAAFVWLA
jgi:YfiH family protein